MECLYYNRCKKLQPEVFGQAWQRHCKEFLKLKKILAISLILAATIFQTMMYSTEEQVFYKPNSWFDFRIRNTYLICCSFICLFSPLLATTAYVTLYSHVIQSRLCNPYTPCKFIVLVANHAVYKKQKIISE